MNALIPIDFLWNCNVKEGVAAILENNLYRWDQKLKGIIKSYEKIRIQDNKCRILDEVSVMLISIKYTVSYYMPKIGKNIIGVVKNWNYSEIGALVESFNAVLTCGKGTFENGIWKDENSIEIKKESKVSFILEK